MNTARSNRPNLVVIMADQLAPQFIASYGHTVAKTPHIDQLVSRGMRFDAAYCNSPLCAPSRFSFMSGQLISRIAAYDNASEFPSTVPTFAHYLRLINYKTCLAGKMHFVGPDQKHGFEDRVTTDIYPSDYAWTPDWEAHDERIDKWYHNMQTVKESGQAVTTYQIDYDEEVSYRTRRWLLDWARETSDIESNTESKPFALVASFIHPHDPYVATPEFWNLYDEADIELPAYVPPLYELDPFSQRIMHGIEASHIRLTDSETRTARHAYLANVSYFDSKVGEIVATLKEIGQLENTVIVVTADHGDMLGERGLWYKMNFFEHSARVPLVFAGPGVTQGSCVSACSLVDLLPTFIELGGGSLQLIASPIDGNSLLPALRESSDDSVSASNTVADVAIGEYCAEMTPYPVLMIRRGSYKYIHCDVDPPQLYDVVNDPLEKNNLAEQADYAELSEAFADEVASRWNGEALRQDVIATQKARHALYAAMVNGKPDHWDYDPPSDASDQYVRNHMDWTVAAARYRFPPLK
ncbi:MAG: choline-sulfatase [Granulosicoccus sp.]|nr:choline-sulfatase [Granulosicoccus sp.]